MRAALAALRPANPRHPRPDQRDRPKALNALGTLAHHPELARAFNTFNGHILFASTLTPRQRETAGPPGGRRCRESAYEWAQHAVLAGDVGLDADDVARIAEGPDAAGLVRRSTRPCVRAVDELIGDAMVSDATWQTAGRRVRRPAAHGPGLHRRRLRDRWPWPSAPSGSSSTTTSGGNDLLFFRD